MPCQFLCASHANKLAQHLDAAAPIWSSWMRRGEAASDASSIQYFGCAFDLAVLLVDRFTAHGELDGLAQGERLVRSAARLAQALAHSGHLALRREYLAEVQRLLHREQQRMPLLADRLPQLDDKLSLSLDAYSRTIRHSGFARQSLN